MKVEPTALTGVIDNINEGNTDAALESLWDILENAPNVWQCEVCDLWFEDKKPLEVNNRIVCSDDCRIEAEDRMNEYTWQDAFEDGRF